MPKVALITGGASGFGLSVATSLAKRGGWDLHLIDLNEQRGNEAASALGAKFHKADVTSYQSLATAFDNAFKTNRCLDFVFANAGIVERDDFYAEQDVDGPPPEPNQLSVDINLKSVINTTYLAQHYFRKSPHKGKEACIVMTSSCGGIYPSVFCPMYTAAKHGVVGFARCVGKPFYVLNGIRVHAICPGVARTNLLDAESWGNFAQECFTPVESITRTVLTLLDGGDIVDSKGKIVPADNSFGLVAEIQGENFYFRDQPEYCDDAMRQVMAKTSFIEQLDASRKD